MEEYRIRFLSGEAEIEESAGRRRFYLVMEGTIKEYEKRMICGSQCPYLLPMHFLTADGKDTAYYDFTGLIRLTEYIERQAAGVIQTWDSRKQVCSALDTLSGILECIKGMESYLIFPERITIHPDTVFIDLINRQVLLAFYPCENTENTFQNRILSLIDAMNEAYRDPEIGRYLVKLKDFIQTGNPGLSGIIAMLGTMQREASYIYWNTESLRKDENEPDEDHGKTCGFQEKSHFARKDRGFAYGCPRFFKPKPDVWKKLPPKKLIAIQVLFLAGLAAAFLSGALDVVSFAGFAVIAAALDYLLIKKLRQI